MNAPNKNKIGELNKTHGQSNTLTWNRWRSMKARCTLVNQKSYPRYGGRGIKVCDKWLNSFIDFLNDMGECPGADWTIERIDNNSDYEPNNCKWANRHQQNRNTSRTHLIDYQGKKLCITDWADELKIPRTTITAWLKNGLDMQGIVEKHRSLQMVKSKK